MAKHTGLKKVGYPESVLVIFARRPAHRLPGESRGNAGFIDMMSEGFMPRINAPALIGSKGIWYTSGRMDCPADKLKGMFDGSPVLVAAYDAADRLRYANLAFRAAYFIEEGTFPRWSEIMRRNFRSGRGTVLKVPDFDAWLMSTESRRGKIPFRSFETDLHDGRWLLMTETVHPDGWMLCIASEITGLRVEERLLRLDRDTALKASQTDDLTGTANRRFVMARIDDMLTKRVPDRPIGCVCVFDLDNFKYINDTFGHHSGDIILRDFAKRIQKLIRRSDTFGRMGGEEFALVLPTASEEQAHSIVERMMFAVRASRPLKIAKGFGYTFSAGISSARLDSTSSELCQRADKALYAAKMAGRNCIRMAESQWRSERLVG
jgi:diguanylate cyclase (GGDEF)-like protein